MNMTQIPPCKKWILPALLLNLMIPRSAEALTAYEDFLYPSLASGGALQSAANSSPGWAGDWQGNSHLLYAPDLNISNRGYALAQFPGSGSLYSDTSNYRAIYRNLRQPISGEIWFSYVFRRGGTGSGGLMFNATSTQALGAPTNWNIAVDATGALNVVVNGVSSPIATVINTQDYLIIGRLVTGSGGTLQVWVNPNLTGITSRGSFLASSQSPAYSNLNAALPATISSVGISAFRASGGGGVFRVDGLRLSDGGGDDAGAFLAAVSDSAPPVLREGFQRFHSNRKWLNTPVFQLNDGRLITLVDNGVVFSSNHMATWSPRQRMLNDAQLAAHPGSFPQGNATMYVTSGGNWVVAWRDDRYPAALDDYWDINNGPVPGATADVWATYSSNQGVTWAAPQQIPAGPGGYPPKQIIETSSGTLVMPIQSHERTPGRNVLRLARSTNQGQTWSLSPDVIDRGGQGHHDGALEPTLVELNDGRIWMLFRTTWDKLGETFSSDDGQTWSAPSLTEIDASSSPPYVERLSDGRLLLLYNQSGPSGGGPSYYRGGDNYYSANVTSWYRQEWSLATSRNDGRTWSDPMIIATAPNVSGRVSYSYFIEVDDGSVLLFSNQGEVEASTPILNLPYPAMTASEDFLYPGLLTGAPVAGGAGGIGEWGGAWQGNLNLLYRSDIDLTYPDYPFEPAAGSLYSQTSNHHAIYREFVEPLQGEIWFSFLFRKGGTGAGGLMFNANSTHTVGGPTGWHVLLGTDGKLRVGVNGVQTELGIIGNATDNLVVGRIRTGSGGLVEVWLNPNLTGVPELSDASLLGQYLVGQPPNYSNLAAVNPASLSSVGIVAYRGTGSSSVFRLDGLQISDGGGINEVPEP